MWTIPPKPTALNRTRKPSPHPTEPADLTATTEPVERFRPWRIDIANPDVIEYPCLPEYSEDLEHLEHLERSECSAVDSSEPATVARRLLLLLGLAYLLVAALTSGLAYTGYFITATNGGSAPDPDGPEPNGLEPGSNPARSGEGASGEEPPDHALPPRPRPPSRDPDAPGLHTRPDGTRYLIMPLPADLTDRFRDRADAVHGTVPAMGGAAL